MSEVKVYQVCSRELGDSVLVEATSFAAAIQIWGDWCSREQNDGEPWNHEPESVNLISDMPVIREAATT